MSAARIPYATARFFEDRREHEAQPSFDDDELRKAAIDELIEERMREVPPWLYDEFAGGRQSIEIDPDSDRWHALPEWLREGLLLQTVPSLRELAAILDEDEVDERASEIGYCAREQ